MKHDIVVDFDGTCVKHAFPFIGDDIGAAPVLKRLVQSGHRLILFTMRSDQGEGYKDIPIIGTTEVLSYYDRNFLQQAVNWFKENGIPLYGIQTNPTQKDWTTSPKAYGQLYIDDCGACIPLVYPESGRPYVDWVQLERWLLAHGFFN